jgi:hypothetical protein
MEGSPAKRRVRDLKKIYGLTPEQYEAMKKAQRGRCAICNRETDKLVIDHNHDTGTVRSLLCNNCNLAIGHLREDVATAEAVAYYLRRHS